MLQPSNCKLSKDMPHEYSLAHGKTRALVLALQDRYRSVPGEPLACTPVTAAEALGPPSVWCRVRSRAILPSHLRRPSPDDQVAVGDTTSDAMFRMFRAQEHSRDWLQPLFRSGSAFTRALQAAGEPSHSRTIERCGKSVGFPRCPASVAEGSHRVPSELSCQS